jgi:hypothetical protein
MTIPESLQALVDALGRLAAPAPDQIEHLTVLGLADLADELALEFDDLYRPRAGQLEDASVEAAAACRELDRMLSSEQLAGRSPSSNRPSGQVSARRRLQRLPR